MVERIPYYTGPSELGAGGAAAPPNIPTFSKAAPPTAPLIILTFISKPPSQYFGPCDGPGVAVNREEKW